MIYATPPTHKLHLLAAAVMAVAAGSPLSIATLGASQEEDAGAQYTLAWGIRNTWRVPDLPNGTPGWTSVGGRPTTAGTAKAISATSAASNYQATIVAASRAPLATAVWSGSELHLTPNRGLDWAFSASAVTGGHNVYAAYVNGAEKNGGAGKSPFAVRQSGCRLVYENKGDIVQNLYACGIRAGNTALGASNDATPITWAGGRDVGTPALVFTAAPAEDAMAHLDVDCGVSGHADYARAPGLRISIPTATTELTGRLYFYGVRGYAGASGSPLDGFGVFDVGVSGYTAVTAGSLMGIGTQQCTLARFQSFVAKMGAMVSCGGPNCYFVYLGQNLSSGAEASELGTAGTSLAAATYATYKANIAAILDVLTATGIAQNGYPPLIVLINAFSTAGTIATPTTIATALERDSTICQRRGLALFELAQERSNCCYADMWQLMGLSPTSVLDTPSFVAVNAEWTTDDIHESQAGSLYRAGVLHAAQLMARRRTHGGLWFPRPPRGRGRVVVK